jgi:hypothetical protein
VLEIRLHTGKRLLGSASVTGVNRVRRQTAHVAFCGKYDMRPDRCTKTLLMVSSTPSNFPLS